MSVESQGRRIKNMLAGMALGDPTRFEGTFTDAGGSKVLADLWDGFGLDLPEAERVPSGGCAVERDGRLLFLRFPQPRAPADPLAFVLWLNENGARVFVLETPVPEAAHLGAGMLVEIRVGGRVAFGPLAQASNAAIRERVLQGMTVSR